MIGSYTFGKISGVSFDWFGLTQFKEFPWETKKQILLRCLFGNLTFIASFVCIFTLPLAVSSSILTCSIFIVVICAYIVRNETMWLLEIVAILFGCFGVIMISNHKFFGNVIK